MKPGKTEKKQETPEPMYVGINARIFAAMVDATLMLIILSFIIPVLSPGISWLYNYFGIKPDVNAFISVIQAGNTSWSRAPEIINAMLKFGLLKKYIADMLVIMTVYAVMILPFWFKKQATPGKMLIRAKIADAKTLLEPSKTQLVMRYLGYPVSVVPLFLGLFYGSFHRKRQSWHDLLAGTVVIYTRKPWLPPLSAAPNMNKVKEMYKQAWDELKNRNNKKK